MQILVDKDGYVTSYALVGELEGGIEVDDPAEEEQFAESFEAHKLMNGALRFDVDKAAEIKERREREFAMLTDKDIDNITDLQLAIAELYEMLLNGGE